MIREHIEVLELEVLMVGEGFKASETTKLLKPAMIKYHDPEWKKPDRRRMESLRASKGN